MDESRGLPDVEQRASLSEGLLDPAAYPWRPERVERVDTHISWVFLAGDRVVKIKRPVVYPFVDHGTLDRREQSCRDEVRLNRRLTDGVYLAAIPIVAFGPGYRVAVGEDHLARTDVVEWATLMRRLPAEGMLDALLAAGTAPADLARRLADRLIPFHRDAAPRCEGDPREVAAAMIKIVSENLDELAPFAGSPLGPRQLRLVTVAMRRFIAEHGELLRQRVVNGWIREGHGDLRAEHVCLEPDGAVQIFDCVEFNLEIRCADVASDLVYLLMDLTERSAGAVARELLARYRAAGFDLPDLVMRFYGAHRALVRVKIACLALADAGPERHAALSATAADYLTMATSAALTVRPALFVMTGLSGTGKSTVAATLARALGVGLIATDAVRQELDDPALATDRWGEGRYTPERKAAVYDALFARGDRALASGTAAILDGTFLDSAQRGAAARLAAAHDVALVLIETVCDEHVIARRIAARAGDATALSDATLDTYRHQRAAIAAAPPVIPPGALHVIIDTSREGAIDLEPAFAVLERGDIFVATIPPLAWPNAAAM